MQINISNNDGEGSVKVTMKFYREQLLYDVRNYAFVEADSMKDDTQHVKHLVADIGEAGNIDRVNRMLTVIHAYIVEMLRPLTEEEVTEETFEDVIEEPEVYEIVMNVPAGISKTTVRLIAKLIHEYIVYRVLGDWLSGLKSDAAGVWLAKCARTENDIKASKNWKRVFTRKISPF